MKVTVALGDIYLCTGDCSVCVVSGSLDIFFHPDSERIAVCLLKVQSLGSKDSVSE